MVNHDAVRFFEQHNMDLEKLLKLEDSYIYTPNEINSIVFEYGFHHEATDTTISVADICGYSRFQTQHPNLFLSLGTYFNSTGDGYHQRSIGLLDYSADEIIQKLEDSFITEPIMVKMISDKEYVISTNGLHRYTVLRAHFLNESIGIEKDSPEFMKLCQKYEIPVKLSNVDWVKTYVNLLLLNNPHFKGLIQLEYDNNYHYTGNVVLKLPSGESKVLNDTELMDLAKQFIALTDEDDYYKTIDLYCAQYDSFNTFVKTNFPELISRQTNKYSGGVIK
ncbi:MAG: hypothetical protein ACOXZW_00395 [Bacilli bacterium]|jgi:hypothetical protein|nr:hypothetical protein [Bacilli bacterium]